MLVRYKTVVTTIGGRTHMSSLGKDITEEELLACQGEVRLLIRDIKHTGSGYFDMETKYGWVVMPTNQVESVLIFPVERGDEVNPASGLRP